MRGFKEPTFQDRAAAGRKAREAALKRLAKQPPVDEAVQAERRAARLAKEAAAAEASAARKAAIEQAKAEKLAKAEEAKKPEPTAAELKAARDAKYAARKQRKK